MVLKAINDTIGPDGITPTLLVYGTIPRMVESDLPTASITQRSNVIKKVMKELQVLRAQKQVNDAINTRNGPNIDELYDLTIGADVLV